MPWEDCIVLSFYQSMNCITDDVTGTCSIATDPVPVQTLIGSGTPEIYPSILGFLVPLYFIVHQKRTIQDGQKMMHKFCFVPIIKLSFCK